MMEEIGTTIPEHQLHNYYKLYGTCATTHNKVVGLYNVHKNQLEPTSVLKLFFCGTVLQTSQQLD